MFTMFAKKLKNNKGTSYIQKGITYFGLLTLFAVCFDLIFIVAQFVISGFMLHNYATKLGIQGGLNGLGQNATIITNSELVKEFKDAFKYIDIKDDEWSLSVRNESTYSPNEYYVYKDSTEYPTVMSNMRFADPGSAILQIKTRWRLSSFVMNPLTKNTRGPTMQHKATFISECW